MATDLERLVVSLSADIKSYEKSLARASGITTSALRKIETDATKSMGRVEQVIGRAGSALAGFGKGLVIGGVFAAVAGLEELVRTSITSAAAIGDLSDKLGISSEKLQELQYGAVQANMSFDDLETGLLKFNKALAQAQNGSGDLLKLLEANGFSKAQIQALSYSKALDVVADLIKNAKNEQDAFLITTQAFGKGSDGFAEFLRGGKQGLDDFAAAANRANAIIKDDLIKNAQVLDDAWAAAMKSMQSQTATFVLNTVSEFQKISGFIDSLLKSTNNLSMPGRFGQPARPALASPTPQSGNIFSEAGNAGGKNYSFSPSPTTKVPDAEIEEAKKKEQALADQRSKNIQRQIGDLRALFAAVDASNVQQEVSTQLSKYDVDAKSAEGKAIADLVEKTEMHKAVLESIAFAAQQAADKQQAFVESETSLAEAGISAFQQWAIEGDKLSDVISNLAKSLLEAAVQASLLGQGPLAGLFGTSASGGLFGNLFNTPKLYAKGGQIGSGSMGIVGEAGPELVQGPANVIPFNKMRGGGTNVQIIDQRTNAPQIEKQQGSDGSLRFLIRDAVIDTIGSGKADSALRARHGITPQKARR